jgi:3-keto-disaccharide hydrolase
MKRLFLIALAVCASATLVAQSTHNSAAQPNTLTAQEKQEGWVLLFDGKTLDQWNVTPTLGKVWKVVDGTIKTDAKAGSGTVLTKEEYSNFVIKAEFRAHPDINSGIILRSPRPQPAPPAGQKPTPAPGGPGYELQIRDKNPGNYSGGDFLTGSIVNVAKAPADVKILQGQWNTIEATVDGDHFVVMYNGKQVADGHDAKRASGAIGLQLAHPEDATEANIEFRNLKLKKLGK